MLETNQQNKAAFLYLQSLEEPSFNEPITKKFNTQEELSLAHNSAWQCKEPFFYSAFSSKAERVICSVITKLEFIGSEKNIAQEYDALLYSSGMAAIYNLMNYLLQNKRGPIVLANELYTGTKGIAAHLSKPYGVPVKHFGEKLNGEESFVFVETFSNPSMQAYDIPGLANECKRKNVSLIVDNTLLTSLHRQLLLEGADYVVYSGTKTLTGHQAVCGAVVGKRDVITNQTFNNLLWQRRITGSCLTDPSTLKNIFAAIKDLPTRISEINSNAKIICDILDSKKVSYSYPGAGPLIFLPNQKGIPNIPYKDSYGASHTSQYAFPHGLRLSIGYDEAFIEEINRWIP